MERSWDSPVENDMLDASARLALTKTCTGISPRNVSTEGCGSMLVSNAGQAVDEDQKMLDETSQCNDWTWDRLGFR